MSTTVYFDLDGTLISYPEDFRSLFDQTLGFQVRDEVYELYVDELFSNLEAVVEDPYFKAFKEINEKFELGIEPAEIAEEYISIELEATELNEELFEFLKFLSENHSVGILTNGATRVQAAKIKKHGLSRFVDEAIISNDVGVRKPDSEIFELAKDRLDAENYVYIGDTHDEDILPAKEAGFQTIYISGEQEADIQSTNSDRLGKILLGLIK